MNIWPSLLLSYFNILPSEFSITHRYFLIRLCVWGDKNSSISPRYDLIFNIFSTSPAPISERIFSTKKFNVLKIKTADCLPIFFFHKNHNIFGVVHAGWKGLKDGIIEESINLIKNHVDNIIDIEVLIGPSISKKNYEVQKEFIDYFGSEFIDEIDNKLFCDLKGIAKSKLKSFGLKNIIDINQCTYENKNFHSFRRDRTSKRMIGLIYYE